MDRHVISVRSTSQHHKNITPYKYRTVQKGNLCPLAAAVSAATIGLADHALLVDTTIVIVRRHNRTSTQVLDFNNKPAKAAQAFGLQTVQ